MADKRSNYWDKYRRRKGFKAPDREKAPISVVVAAVEECCRDVGVILTAQEKSMMLMLSQGQDGAGTPNP